MRRVNVIGEDEQGFRRVIGWFDASKTEGWAQATRWDGQNHVSVNTGSQWIGQELSRTKGGRWVLREWSADAGHGDGLYDRYRFITTTQAGEWLQLNGHDDAVERFFGPQPDESGPDEGPTPMRNLRIPPELWSAAMARAAQDGTSVSAVIRDALTTYATEN